MKGGGASHHSALGWSSQPWPGLGPWPRRSRQQPNYGVQRNRPAGRQQAAVVLLQIHRPLGRPAPWTGTACGHWHCRQPRNRHVLQSLARCIPRGPSRAGKQTARVTSAATRLQLGGFNGNRSPWGACAHAAPARGTCYLVPPGRAGRPDRAGGRLWPLAPRSPSHRDTSRGVSPHRPSLRTASGVRVGHACPECPSSFERPGGRRGTTGGGGGGPRATSVSTCLSFAETTVLAKSAHGGGVFPSRLANSIEATTYSDRSSDAECVRQRITRPCA